MCAWDVGGQKPRKNTLISNKEILERKGYLDEKEAKLLFYQFLRNNISFAAELLCDTTLLPFQHIMIKSMLESDYVLGVVARGGSKSWSTAIYAFLDATFNQGIQIGIISSGFRQCLEENEFVLLSTGLKRIKDVNVGDKIFAKEGLQEVKNKWKNEPSEGLRIVTSKRYSVKGKKDHRILVFDLEKEDVVYKELKDIKVGDLAAISCESRGEGKEQMLDFKQAEGKKWLIKPMVNPVDDDDFYYLLGHFIGDGTYRESNKGPCFSTVSADQEIIDFLERYLNKLLPENNIRHQRKDTYSVIQLSSKRLAEAFEHMGYKVNTFAITKTIPEKVLRAKKEHIAAFLRGYLDADGCININADERYKSAKVNLTTASLEMARQFQLILLTFGIISSMKVRKEIGETIVCGKKCFVREGYDVCFSNFHNLDLFYKQIGFKLSRKQNKLKSYLENCVNNTVQTIQPPTAKWNKKVKDAIKRFLYKNPESSHLFFDDIKEINPLEDIITYDIEVDNEHCYWGNGFINHNSKLLFKKIEDIQSKPGAYLMNQAIGKVNHNSDSWSMEIGRSRIIALPLGDGEKLRGYRFNRIIIDEFLLMPERIVTEIVSPFLAVIQNPVERKKIYDLETKLIAQGDLKEDDRYEWPSNKLICLSSASYKFENLYKYYQNYERLILNPKPDDKARRCIIQLSYEALPNQLYDGNQIQQAKATMSDAQFSREYGAQFTNESEGFFSVQKMLACTVPEGELPCVEVVGNPADEYIIGLDSSWAESETSDSFAIQVLKLLPEKKSTVLVHSYEIPGMALKDHIAYFHYLLTNFNTVAICMDMNGGLTFMSACNESECFKKSGILLKTIDTKFDKAEEYNSDLIAAKNEYNRLNHRYVIQRIPTSQWIRTANELMQAYLDNKRIYFASQAIDTEFRRQINKNIGISNLKYKRKTAEEESLDNVDWDANEGNVSDTKNKALMIDFLEHLHDTIQLTKTQLAMITPTTSIQGTQTFDLPKNIKGSGRDRARKDSYSALILANWMAKIYFDLQSVNVEETDSTFTPMMI
jgi:intein/homing endonuclease